MFDFEDYGIKKEKKVIHREILMLSHHYLSSAAVCRFRGGFVTCFSARGSYAARGSRGVILAPHCGLRPLCGINCTSCVLPLRGSNPGWVIPTLRGVSS